MYESFSSIRKARKQYLRFEVARFEAITSTLALITEVPVSSACHYRLEEELQREKEMCEEMAEEERLSRSIYLAEQNRILAERRLMRQEDSLSKQHTLQMKKVLCITFLPSFLKPIHLFPSFLIIFSNFTFRLQMQLPVYTLLRQLSRKK